VTCLGYSNDELTGSNAIIVSGSADATVLVWIWDHKSHRIIGPNDATGHGSTPIAICTGHELPITCVDVNSSIGIIASGSLEGACLLHSISGDLLYSLKGPSVCQHPRLISISNIGNILVNYSDENGYMAMYTSNGKILSHVKLTEQNLAAVFTNDGCFLIAGGFGRSFQVWRSFDLVLLSVFPPCDGSIRALALTQDQKCMVAGLSTGSIIAMAMDFKMWPRLYSPQPQTTSSTTNDVTVNTENDKPEEVKPNESDDRQATAIVDKVPEVSEIMQETNGSVEKQQPNDNVEKKQESKSSSITDPVPEDSFELPAVTTKTLLEKSLEMESSDDNDNKPISDDQKENSPIVEAIENTFEESSAPHDGVQPISDNIQPISAGDSIKEEQISDVDEVIRHADISEGVVETKNDVELVKQDENSEG